MTPRHRVRNSQAIIADRTRWTVRRAAAAFKRSNFAAPPPHGVAMAPSHDKPSAHDHPQDFVLFPHDLTYSNSQVAASDDSFGAFYRPSHPMDDHHRFAPPDRTAYDSYPDHPAQMASAPYFEPNNHHLQNFMKVGEHVPASRATPSASPSSMSQTFDHAASTLSSASGASVQSTSSSVDGSPYVHATQQMPYQDKWSHPAFGLGIHPQGANNDLYGNDQGNNIHGESDVAMDAGRYHDFVGKYREKVSTSFPTVPSFPSPISSVSSSQDLSLSAHSPSPAGWPGAPRKENEAVNSLQGGIGSSYTPSSSPTPSTTGPSQARVSTSPVYARPFQSPRSPRPVWTPTLRTSGLRSPHHRSSDDHWETTSGSRAVSPTISRQRQDLFFGQSSGRFVAPLQSSCRLPLHTVILQRAFSFSKNHALLSFHFSVTVIVFKYTPLGRMTLTFDCEL